MYKFNRNRQFSFSDFNQPIGLKMNPENRWVKKSETITWDEIEERYSSLFPKNDSSDAVLEGIEPIQTEKEIQPNKIDGYLTQQELNDLLNRLMDEESSDSNEG